MILPGDLLCFHSKSGYSPGRITDKTLARTIDELFMIIYGTKPGQIRPEHHCVPYDSLVLVVRVPVYDQPWPFNTPNPGVCHVLYQNFVGWLTLYSMEKLEL